MYLVPTIHRCAGGRSLLRTDGLLHALRGTRVFDNCTRLCFPLFYTSTSTIFPFRVGYEYSYSYYEIFPDLCTSMSTGTHPRKFPRLLIVENLIFISHV